MSITEESGGLHRVESDEVVELEYSRCLNIEERRLPRQQQQPDLTLCEFPITQSRSKTKKFEVRANKALIRSGVSLESDEVLIVRRGKVLDTNKVKKVTECGTTRLRIVEPCLGWISWKCGREYEWEKKSASGQARWILDLASWRPSLGETGQEWHFLLSLIPQSKERNRIAAYARWLDRARALASRLLALKCCSLVTGISDYAQLPFIQRTKGGKPYLSLCVNDDHIRRPPNFNFNISHDGRFVVLASEPLTIVGIDVAAPESLRRLAHSNTTKDKPIDHQSKATSARALVELAKACRHTNPRHSVDEDTTNDDEASWERLASVTLSKNGSERAYILDSNHTCPWPQHQTQSERFRCIWASKEAITKARGDGLACPFNSIQLELRHGPLHVSKHGGLDDDDDDDDENDANEYLEKPIRTFHVATIRIDGLLLKGWRVEGKVLDSSHVVAVAQAPVSAVIDADGGFSATLQQRNLLNTQIDTFESPDFAVLDFSDLVPPAKIPIYQAVCAADQELLEKRRSKLKRVSISDTELNRPERDTLAQSFSINPFKAVESMLSPPIEEADHEPFSEEAAAADDDDNDANNDHVPPMKSFSLSQMRPSTAPTVSQFTSTRRASSGPTVLNRTASHKVPRQKSIIHVRRSHSAPNDLSGAAAFL